MQIVITSPSGTPLTQLEQILSLSYEKHLNAAGNLTLTTHYRESHLSESVLTQGNHITLYYQNVELFRGIITGIKYTQSQISLQALDLLGYLDYRILRANRTYTAQSVQSIISDLYTYFSELADLPLTLGVNDITTIVTKKFSAGDSFLSVLKSLISDTGEFRVEKGLLDFATQTGQTHATQLFYSAQDPLGTNVVEWSWTQALTDFANGILEYDDSTLSYRTDSTSIARHGLFEKYKYSSSGATSSTPSTSVKLPKLTIDPRRLEWWRYAVGDRVPVRLTTLPSYIDLTYTGVVQDLTFTLKDSTPSLTLTVAESYTTPADFISQIADLRGRLRQLELKA